MLKIYGTMMCKDCVACVHDLTAANIPFTFYDFQDSLDYLKEFLKLRDASPLFDHARANGAIGIPCVVLEDGTLTLDWDLISTRTQVRGRD